MRWFETIIVGSGASGIAAARKLESPGTAIIDAGMTTDKEFKWTSLYEARQSGEITDILGEQWEMLANLKSNRIHDKLKAPSIRYVESGEPFKVYNDIGSITTQGRGSYARGGFANAWGAQVYRYTQKDLDFMGDWPISANDLTKHYNSLETHIGISGENDDLSIFFNNSSTLLPPTPLTHSSQGLMLNYESKKNILNNNGLIIGRPRLAVLTMPHNQRPAHNFGETEFFDTSPKGIYTPQLSLDEMIRRNKLNYISGLKLIKYRETDNAVELEFSDIATGEKQFFKTRTLLLACGALHSSKLVLENNSEKGRSLPFIDHPPTLVPLFMPSHFGRPLPRKSFPTQLAACFNFNGEEQMISVYYAGGILRSDLLTNLPFTFKDNLWLLNRILSGFLVLQIWEPSKPNSKNKLSIDKTGNIRIDYAERPENAGISTLLKLFRKLGAVGLKRFTQDSPAGWGFHFAGSLPMRHNPGPYETDRNGRLWNCERVHVIDGSILPSLPSKNHTFTLMANSSRIAEIISKCK